MKRLLLVAAMVQVLFLSAQERVAKWGQCPEGWTDFRMGLVCENYDILKARIKQALKEGAKLDYRYIYINNGVDPTNNAISWLFTEWTDYAKESVALGVKPAYVIYMLQEEGGRTALLQHINDPAFMKKYFNSVKIVAEKSKGMNAVFILEPDTWGYYLQAGLEGNLNIDPTKEPAHVNDLGTGYEWLQGIPNTMPGVVQGLIKTIRTFAPDAYCGVLMSHWAVFANGKTGPSVPNGGDGMVYWNKSDIEYSAVQNADFGNKLLSGGTDRGDFIGVEKNGWSAGRWKKQGINFWYWGDEQNSNWVYWVEKLSRTMDMPALGWQISIGHMGLPNADNSYEDTFFPYFYQHPQDYMNAGLIGCLVGKGLADDTDFSNLNGNEKDSNDGQKGDRGWFFEQMKQFDKGRPYICKTNEVTDIVVQENPPLTITGNSIKHLQWNNSLDVEQAILYNIAGRVLLTLPVVNNVATLNTNDLASGIYVLKTNVSTHKVNIVK